jgi:Mn2+/Fe2+ NRAMP family transporter
MILLTVSQVILSMRLSFAVIPLVLFTSKKLKMGEFVNPPSEFWTYPFGQQFRHRRGNESFATMTATIKTWALTASLPNTVSKRRRR